MEGRKYFFQPEKKVVKQGFFLTDENEKVVYETKVIKTSLLGPATVDFINHAAGTTQQHKIGKTITVEQDTGTIFDMLAKKSYFKYDGVKIWDYLHQQGIRLNTGIATDRLGMSYDVTLKGQPIATIATAGPKGGKVLTTRFCLEVTTLEQYLDLAFLVAFAIARTEQTLYN